MSNDNSQSESRSSMNHCNNQDKQFICDGPIERTKWSMDCKRKLLPWLTKSKCWPSQSSKGPYKDENKSCPDKCAKEWDQVYVLMMRKRKRDLKVPSEEIIK